jgi:hypothetical protein
MLEVIGFLVWVLSALLLTAAPVGILGLSALGGGVGRAEKALILIAACLALLSWYYIFTSLTISLN